LSHKGKLQPTLLRFLIDYSGEYEMVYIVGIGGTLRKNSRSYRALEIAMSVVQTAGAETEILSLYELDLPMFYPDKAENEYGENVQRLLASLRRADGLILSTGGYHGTMAGATKNMLDYVEYMSDDKLPYLHQRVVGLIATAGGALASVNTINTFVYTVHSLRGIVVPLSVPIPSASKAFKDGELIDEAVHKKLQQMAHETVRLSKLLNPTTVEV
jgi:FMN reductase